MPCRCLTHTQTQICPSSFSLLNSFSSFFSYNWVTLVGTKFVLQALRRQGGSSRSFLVTSQWEVWRTLNMPQMKPSQTNRNYSPVRAQDWTTNTINQPSRGHQCWDKEAGCKSPLWMPPLTLLLYRLRGGLTWLSPFRGSWFTGWSDRVKWRVCGFLPCLHDSQRKTKREIKVKFQLNNRSSAASQLHRVHLPGGFWFILPSHIKFIILKEYRKHLVAPSVGQFLVNIESVPLRGHNSSLSVSMADAQQVAIHHRPSCHLSAVCQPGFLLYFHNNASRLGPETDRKLGHPSMSVLPLRGDITPSGRCS